MWFYSWQYLVHVLGHGTWDPKHRKKRKRSKKWNNKVFSPPPLAAAKAGSNHHEQVNVSSIPTATGTGEGYSQTISITCIRLVASLHRCDLPCKRNTDLTQFFLFYRLSLWMIHRTATFVSVFWFLKMTSSLLYCTVHFTPGQLSQGEINKLFRLPSQFQKVKFLTYNLSYHEGKV